MTCRAVADGQASADEVVLDVDDQKSADGPNDLIENSFLILQWQPTFCSGNRHSKMFTLLKNSLVLTKMPTLMTTQYNLIKYTYSLDLTLIFQVIFHTIGRWPDLVCFNLKTKKRRIFDKK